MPHHHSSFDQLRELERRRNTRGAARDIPRQSYQRRYPANTLGPNEDIVERRRGMNRKHVTVTGASPQNRNILFENLIILIFLAVSIWGLYSLIIYLLTHS